MADYNCVRNGADERAKPVPLEIKWLGHASFRFSGKSSVAYIDPWKLKAATHDADVVFVSHGHHDHCSPDDIAKVCKADTAILAPAGADVAPAQITQVISPGQTLQIKHITIQTVPAYNIGKDFHPRANNWCGAVFTFGRTRVYYAGDTDLIPEMSDLNNIDIALLPIGGTYTLDAAEAARACQAIGCKTAIPYHWGDIVGSQADVDEFVRLLHLEKCGVTVLKPA